MPEITILTPAYNRGHLLGRLYQSLCNQSSKDFKWLIVDDGSQDDTKSVVQRWFGHTDFEIDYIYKDNGGKHTALNKGIEVIDTRMTVIVDSDDVLLPDAIETILKYEKKYGGKSLTALSFLKVFSDGSPVIGMDKDEEISTYIQYRIKENRPGDMAEVFYTKYLKEERFPEFKGEKFLSEDVVWIQIAKRGAFAYINKPIYVCEYLEGGLTANDKPMKFASPKGSMLRGKRLMSPECGFKANIKGAIIYDVYRRETESVDELILQLSKREKVLTSLAYPLSGYYYKKWRS